MDKVLKKPTKLADIKEIGKASYKDYTIEFHLQDGNLVGNDIDENGMMHWGLPVFDFLIEKLKIKKAKIIKADPHLKADINKSMDVKKVANKLKEAAEVCPPLEIVIDTELFAYEYSEHVEDLYEGPLIKWKKSFDDFKKRILQ